jgi:hypothetical protein
MVVICYPCHILSLSTTAPAKSTKAEWREAPPVALSWVRAPSLYAIIGFFGSRLWRRRTAALRSLPAVVCHPTNRLKRVESRHSVSVIGAKFSRFCDGLRIFRSTLLCSEITRSCLMQTCHSSALRDFDVPRLRCRPGGRALPRPPEIEDLNFGEAMAELEKITRWLESHAA